MKVLNNFKWMAAAMLVAMTAACSDSDIATQDPVPPQQTLKISRLQNKHPVLHPRM